MKQQENERLRAEETERFCPDPEFGLTSEQVQRRVDDGLFNKDSTLPTKSVKTIVRENVCTLFNLINLVLAVAVLLVGSFKNMTFMGVVLCNLAIGIFQELRAKQTVDKLSLLSEVKSSVMRGGKRVAVPTDEVVLDDILVLASGKQVAADCRLISGECEVNESFVTGEADAIVKKQGDELLAGSFVVSGTGRARVEQVGEGNYISSISRGAKELKGINSEIMRTLKTIIMVISIIIIPVGAFLFYNQFHLNHTVSEAVVQTVAALVGMIPEGLMLLTSTVLAVSVIRLSRHKVLVQELYCIETLARVDTLCLDKTGTLTEGVMEVGELAALGEADPEELEDAICAMLAALPDHNATFDALEKRYGAETAWRATAAAPFSSRTKWSGASFKEHGTYILGAAEFILKQMPADLKERLEACAEKGRVLLLAHAQEALGQRDSAGAFTLPEGLKPVGLVVLQDKIREQAADTLKYFSDEGVNIKVISGDGVTTVSQIARRTGVKNWDKAVDASTLETEEEIRAAAVEYTVFGRVTPSQKKQLVCALKEAGHTVAMTGDGVNDVLALKEADCSVAMASGSDTARNISQLVLLESNFDAMPRVVGEGRRSINNIQRSASMFLVKTMYSTLLAILFLFIQMPYPFEPIQLTLISSLTIGFPAFVLALEPNRRRVEGNFLKNILMRAIPGAVGVVLSILLSLLASQLFEISAQEISTMCVLLAGFTGFLLLFRLSSPFNPWRKVLYVGLLTAFAFCVIFLAELFSLVMLSPIATVALIVIADAVFFLFDFLTWLTKKLLYRKRKK